MEGEKTTGRPRMTLLDSKLKQKPDSMMNGDIGCINLARTKGEDE